MSPGYVLVLPVSWLNMLVLTTFRSFGNSRFCVERSYATMFKGMATKCNFDVKTTNIHFSSDIFNGLCVTSCTDDLEIAADWKQP